MGRPIKFRVWSKGLNRFFKNEYFSSEEPYAEEDCQVRLGDNNQIWQQFTGLLDKNNKEIYEGDIVTYQAGEPNRNDRSFYKGKSVVKFENGAFWPRPIKEEYEDSWYNYELKDLEVIGNIFENPELA